MTGVIIATLALVLFVAYGINRTFGHGVLFVLFMGTLVWVVNFTDNRDRAVCEKIGMKMVVIGHGTRLCVDGNSFLHLVPQ